MCEMHYVITFFLVAYLFALMMMAYELIRVSSESDAEMPESFEKPWVPGGKFIARSAVSATEQIRKVSKKRVSAEVAEGKLDHPIDGIGQKFVRDVVEQIKRPIVGTLEISAGAGRYCAQQASKGGRHFEHGRMLVEEDKPAKWTFVATLVAFLLGLFMVIGPFNTFFF